MNAVTKRKLSLIFFGLFSVLFFYGCEGKSGADWDSLSPTGPTGVDTGDSSEIITLTPSSLTIAIGGKQQFSATGGTGAYTWSVDDTSLGTISNPSGTFRAGDRSGSVTVICTDASGNIGTVKVTVVYTWISISPSGASMNAGETETFTASGGVEPYSWSVSDGNLGTIDSESGVFTAGSTGGTVTISATDAEGYQGTTTVTIIGSSVTVSPSSATLKTGETETFTASGGSGSYTWSVSDSDLGSIDSDGEFTAGDSEGTVTVTATDSSGNTGIATVTITFSDIIVSPSDTSVSALGTETFTATGGDGAYTWSVDDTSLGSIDSDSGEFTAGSVVGTVTVTATDSSGNTGSTTVTIT